MNKQFDKYFVISSFVLLILGVTLFSYLDYQEHKETFYEHIDEKLLSSAKTTLHILPPNFHDRALAASSISQAEHTRNIDRLSKLSESLNVAYLYTMTMKEGKIYFTASSATDEERKTGVNLTHYFDNYDDASEALKNAFQTGRISFDEYSDKWGTFRSVFIPLKSPGGHSYMVSADIRIDEINKVLQKDAFSLFLRLLGVVAVGVLLLTWRLRKINKKLETEKESLLENLKNEQQHLYNILWGTGAGTWEWNVQSGENVVNEEWAQILGYTLEELSPVHYTTWEKLTHPEDFAQANTIMELHFRGECDYYECDMRMRHKSGEWIWVLTRGRVISYDVHKKPLWMAGVLLSITQRVESENQLRKLSQAVEQSPTSIIITDLDGTIEYANSHFFTTSGYFKSEVIGKNPKIFKSGKTPRGTYEDMWATLRRGLNWHGEFINLGKDKTEYVQSVHISPIFQANGKITHYVAVEEDITEKKRIEERIYHLANFDTLTGLPNRGQLDNFFKYILSHSKRNKTSFAVMFLDLDKFKEINDTLGHTIGDGMLVESAKRFKSLIRDVDIVARMGGDEFIFILSNTDAHGVESVVQKLLESIREPYMIEQYKLNISASIGIAIYPYDGKDVETLSKNADTAMYSAKEEGRNGYRFFTTEMQIKSFWNLQLNTALRDALKNKEFHLVYQPQLSIENEKITGAEALIRWNNPELGSISPVEFIPAAEENGLILPIGEWVLRTAVAQVREWMDSSLPPIVMSVNLSTVQFRHHDLPNLVSRILHEYDVPPRYLELELTESMAMHDPGTAINIMRNFHERGIRMSIDDFGTGYSSLNYLKKFKIYKLKIDQSFVRDISTDADDKAIVSAVINMAHSLGLKTIAEGVETIEQLEYLRGQGCDEVQGYYYSKPLPASEFQAFIRDKTNH
ncbi:MAG: EAL domain-containing protein [Sulfuricurvum sp.]|nr:EAL domain-containing protein [Sulfuricurvum sp.]